MYRRSPRSLALALDQMRDDLGPATPLAEVQRVWSEAVGATIAGEATPTSERGGVLTVSCSSSVWAQELDLMAPVLIEQLNARLRGVQLSRLRCVALLPRAY
jgi:predicted nucleic acid-binding Zn ribbon protein